MLTLRVVVAALIIVVFGLLGFLVFLVWTRRGLTVPVVSTASVAVANLALLLVTVRLAWHAEESAKSAKETAQLVSETLVESKRDRSLEFLARWNDPAFLKHLVAVWRRLGNVGPVSPLDESFIVVCFFFTELSLLVEGRAVDENLVKRFLGPAVRFYPQLQPWMDEHKRTVGQEEQ